MLLIVGKVLIEEKSFIMKAPPSLFMTLIKIMIGRLTVSNSKQQEEPEHQISYFCKQTAEISCLLLLAYLLY